MAVKCNNQRANAEDLPWLTQYFASAGSLYEGRPASLIMLPFCEGKLLRFFWKQANAEVFDLVTPRAFDLMELEFGPGHPSRNFYAWPTDTRRAIYAECRASGCAFVIDAHGNVLCVDDPPRRSLEELNAEYAARKAAGTIGKHDPRFPDARFDK